MSIFSFPSLSRLTIAALNPCLLFPTSRSSQGHSLLVVFYVENGLYFPVCMLSYFGLYSGHCKCCVVETLSAIMVLQRVFLLLL